MIPAEQPSSSYSSFIATAAGPQPTDEAPIRGDMIQMAQQFLQNPRVQGTPVEDQRKFLRSKGLTDPEIDEAFRIMWSTAQMMSYQSSFPASGRRFMAACQSVFLISGASYMAYKFARTWLLPKFFDIPDPAQEQIESLQTQMNELQNSTKFIMDSVVQTLETVSTQQEQLNRAIMLLNASVTKAKEFEAIQSELKILKSLLLNQSQFPPLPDHSTRQNGKVNGFEKNSHASPKNAIETNGIKDDSKNDHNASA